MSVAKFYTIEQEKLINEFEKITLFTKHPTTIGTYRERILKTYLQQFTPKSLKIDSGFVYDFENAKKNELYYEQTKQVDCLVYDENNFTPFLTTIDFAIIEPAALFAGIEIKSSLTFYKEYDKSTSEPSIKYPLMTEPGKPYKWAGTIIVAIENIKSISQIASKYKRTFFKGIFAYSSTVNLKDLLFAFDNQEIQKQLELSHLDELPWYICVPQSYLVSFTRVPLSEDESMGFDPSQSEMTVIESVAGNESFPLQFFTNSYKVQIEHSLTKKTPHKAGLFTAGNGNMKMWGHHFPLSSK